MVVFWLLFPEFGFGEVVGELEEVGIFLAQVLELADVIAVGHVGDARVVGLRRCGVV